MHERKAAARQKRSLSTFNDPNRENLPESRSKFQSFLLLIENKLEIPAAKPKSNLDFCGQSCTN